MAAALDAWQDDRVGHPGGDRRSGRQGLLRRRGHPAALRPWARRRPRSATDVLARGISAQRADPHLSEADRRPDRRHRDGRRGRRLDQRLAPGGGRALLLRHAGGRHRLFSRRRRNLFSASPGAPGWRLSCADGPARQCRRRAGLRSGADLRSERGLRPARPGARGRRRGRRDARPFRRRAAAVRSDGGGRRRSKPASPRTAARRSSRRWKRRSARVSPSPGRPAPPC